VAVASELDSVRSCDPNRPTLFAFDAGVGRITGAEFDTRLFSRPALCYSGALPAARTIGLDRREDGKLELRNGGSAAWPKGLLLVDGSVRELPALAPGESATPDRNVADASDDRAVRAALAYSSTARAAALWTVDGPALPKLPAGSAGWLLVTIPFR
jgi:hypothetical protein